MDIEQYIEIRREIPLEKVSFGYQTMILFPVEELEEAQVGYSVDPSGVTLTGEDEGDWKNSWLVIGYEELCGDPFFVDLNVQGLTVFTAAHGEGMWNPVFVASSFNGFIESLNEIRRISHGRGYPVALEQNPLPKVERKRILNKIAELNGNGSLEFWESWFEV